MIALDTNVLVRLILHDDEEQARTAERLVIKARHAQLPLFISDIVLCELVWVLTRRAGLGRREIADAIERVLRTELIVVTDTSVAERSLEAYRNGKGDFADYLIREQAFAADATEVVTFDRALKGDAGFRVIASR
jgi:predicted nucleic-acid-binding protein